MTIIFNPKNGAPIHDFIWDNVMLEDHLPGELKQYNDSTANELLERYPFLESVTAEQAKEIIARPKEPTLKCEFCDFKTDAKIALIGHTRKHANETAQKKEPLLDPNIVPIASGKKASGITNRSKEDETKNGLDKDGVSWYGEGLVEETSLSGVKPIGVGGHFGG